MSIVSEILSGATSGAALGSIIPGIGTAIGAGIGGLMGGTSGILDGSSAKGQMYKQYKYNIALQRENQDFMKWQMGNAHQQEVQDLEAAGLNPVLSAGGNGASAVSGGQTQVNQSDPNSDINAMLGISSALTQMKKTNAETNYLEAKTEQTKTNTIWTPELNRSLVKLQNASTAKTKQETIKTIAETEAIKFNNKMKEMDIQKRTSQYDKELEIYKAKLERELIEAGYDKSTVKQVINAIGNAVNALSPMTTMTGRSESQSNYTTWSHQF